MTDSKIANAIKMIRRAIAEGHHPVDPSVLNEPTLSDEPLTEEEREEQRWLSRSDLSFRSWRGVFGGFYYHYYQNYHLMVNFPTAGETPGSAPFRKPTSDSNLLSLLSKLSSNGQFSDSEVFGLSSGRGEGV